MASKDEQRFYVKLNDKADLEGYGYGVPVLAEDVQSGVETEFKRGIPREVSESEYKRLTEDRPNGVQAVLKA